MAFFFPRMSPSIISCQFLTGVSRFGNDFGLSIPLSHPNDFTWGLFHMEMTKRFIPKNTHRKGKNIQKKSIQGRLARSAWGVVHKIRRKESQECVRVENYKFIKNVLHLLPIQSGAACHNDTNGLGRR